MLIRWSRILCKPIFVFPSSSACVQGLGLGQEALGILRSFGLTEQLEEISLPLPVEINTAVKPSGETKELQRDDHYNHRA
jgi:hypothetical protein